MNCKFIWIFIDSGMVVSLLCSGSSLAWRPLPPCGYCLKASMTGGIAALHGCNLHRWLWVVGLGVAGTVSHMANQLWLPM